MEWPCICLGYVFKQCGKQSMWDSIRWGIHVFTDDDDDDDDDDDGDDDTGDDDGDDDDMVIMMILMMVVIMVTMIICIHQRKIYQNTIVNQHRFFYTVQEDKIFINTLRPTQNGCKSLKIIVLWFRIHWGLFPMVQFTTSQHCFGQYVGTERSTAIIWTSLIARFMGPTWGRPIWGRQDPGGPHVGPMNLAI